MKLSIVMEYSHAALSDEIELEIADGLSDEEIEDAARDEVSNYFSWGYAIKTPEPEEA